MNDNLFHVGPAKELRASGQKVVQAGRGPILVLWHNDAFFALDNRCPHMGFPLHQGDVHDGLLDCHWHHARFDISCGATLDPWADDVDSYRVLEKEGEVFLDLSLPPQDPKEHGIKRLDRGLKDSLRLVLAKAVIELLDAKVSLSLPLVKAALYGAKEREDGWQPGLSILSAMANVFAQLSKEDKPRALVHSIAHIASDCSGRPPRRPLPPLEGCQRSLSGLTDWLRETVEVRDDDGTERILSTLVSSYGPNEALHAVLAACTDHRYSDVGHTLDYALKCAELAEHFGENRSQEDLMLLFSSLAPQLVSMRRMEESSSWRRPVDVAALVESAGKEVFEKEFSKEGKALEKEQEDSLVKLLLGEEPEATIKELLRLLHFEKISPVFLAESIVTAAIKRVLQFGSANEVSDWDTVHHTLTYANAVAEGMRRVPSKELFRAVLDGAMSVYLDRFLNIPAAKLPKLNQNETRTPEVLLEDLLKTYNGRSQLEETTYLSFAFLEKGGNPQKLFQTLGTVVLREDASFHPFQQLEIAWRRMQRRPDSEAAKWSLVALARWLAAQFPTRRAREQTFQIARRLMRGEAIFDE